MTNQIIIAYKQNVLNIATKLLYTDGLNTLKREIQKLIQLVSKGRSAALIYNGEVITTGEKLILEEEGYWSATLIDLDKDFSEEGRERFTKLMDNFKNIANEKQEFMSRFVHLITHLDTLDDYWLILPDKFCEEMGKRHRTFNSNIIKMRKAKNNNTLVASPQANIYINEYPEKIKELNKLIKERMFRNLVLGKLLV